MDLTQPEPQYYTHVIHGSYKQFSGIRNDYMKGIAARIYEQVGSTRQLLAKGSDDEASRTVANDRNLQRLAVFGGAGPGNDEGITGVDRRSGRLRRR